MRNLFRFGWSLAVLLAGAAAVSAQQQLPATPGPVAVAPQAFAPAPTGDASRFWFQADYILWWVKSAPNPAPLVTTGPFDPNTFAGGPPFPAAIGSPGTAVLAGNNNVNFGGMSGFRLYGGAGLDSDGIFAFEGGGFLLPKQTRTFSVASNSSGVPFLGLPIQDLAGVEHVVAVAFANDAANLFGGAAGSLSVTNSLQFWGAEANFAANVLSTNRVRADVLVGFRYLDLQESLGIDGQTTPIGQPLVNSFAGQNVLLGQTLQTSDSFSTRNQFYGGQVGTRFDAALGDRFNLELVAKIALGSTHQHSSVNGSTTLFTPGAVPQTVPGGIYAQLSNIGTQTGNSFSAIPEINFNLSYNITRNVRFLVGYSFIYWDNVVRAGNQVDHVVDPRAIASIPVFVPGLTPTRPAPLFERSDFWAQGVNFGLEFRF